MFAQYPQMNFPLQVGNRWQYSEVPGNFSESKSIKDTLMPNGLTYTEIQGELFGGFFRKDSSKVFLYNPAANEETLLYDFSEQTGDTLLIQISGADTIVKTVYEEGIRSVFGQQRHFISFLTRFSSSIYGIDYITDSLGFTGYNGEVLSYGLTGAIINGIQYGEIYSNWEKDIIFSPDSLFLWNYNRIDSCKIINNSDQNIYLDSVSNKSFSSYGCLIKKDSEYYFRVNPYQKSDSLNIPINPGDTLLFIIADVDVCPICKKQYDEYLKDTLVFAFSADSNQATEKLILLNSDISLDIEDDNLKINSFYLSQNFPNPFNSRTKIKYSVPKSGFVTLKVYDLLGKEITTLVNEERTVGNYEIIFDADNLSSGVYFYKIYAGSFADTKKFILLK